MNEAQKENLKLKAAQLLPCPFCGAKAEVKGECLGPDYEDGEFDGYQIVCSNIDGCYTEQAMSDNDWAIIKARWNRRTS